MIQAIKEAVGRPATKVKGVPWPLLALAGLFQQTPRELYKMRYFWQTAMRLDNAKLVAFLGEEPPRRCARRSDRRLPHRR